MEKRGLGLVLIGLCLIVAIMLADKLVAPIGEPMNSLLTIGGIVLELAGGYLIIKNNRRQQEERKALHSQKGKGKKKRR